MAEEVAGNYLTNLHNIYLVWLCRRELVNIPDWFIAWSLLAKKRTPVGPETVWSPKEMRTVLEIPSGYEASDRSMIQIVRAIGVINVKNAYVEIRTPWIVATVQVEKLKCLETRNTYRILVPKPLGKQLC
jgi:hypothetical protein